MKKNHSVSSALSSPQWMKQSMVKKKKIMQGPRSSQGKVLQKEFVVQVKCVRNKVQFILSEYVGKIMFYPNFEQVKRL